MLKRTRHSEDIINRLRNDRELGLSIPELMVKYQMAKTTIWHHIHDIVLSDEKKKRIMSLKGGSRCRRLQQEQKAELMVRDLLQSSDREFIIAVSMLYWAEGHKKNLIFTNTDPAMLSMYLKFLTTIFKIETQKIVVLIRTSDPINPLDAINFWSKCLCLPLSAFVTNHDNIQNRTKTKYGICRVSVKKSEYYHKAMMCLIRSVQAEYCPCSLTDRTPHS